MHVLIATDGALDGAAVARFATRLAGEDGRVTVFTAVETNRNLLRELRSLYGERGDVTTDQDAEYVGVHHAASPVSSAWPGDDEMIGRYLRQQADRRTAGLVASLSELGIAAEVSVVESEDPAKAIIAAIDELQADVVCVGSHGRGLFEGLLGSTGTKVARRSPKPVLVMRSA